MVGVGDGERKRSGMQKVFEKIKELLIEEMANISERFGEKKSYIHIDEVLAIIDEVASDIYVGHKNGWIPCSERLPDDREFKLVYLSTDRITVARYNEYILPSIGKPIGWGYRVSDGYIDLINERVIAWQPLPEPYKENKND